MQKIHVDIARHCAQLDNNSMFEPRLEVCMEAMHVSKSLF